MKLQDKETSNIAKAVSDVLEGKKSVKEIKYPHKMYHPDSGEEVEAKNEKEHNDYSEKGYTHTKPVKEVEEPRAKGEKDFKDKHAVKKSGMNTDGSNIKEGYVGILDLKDADYKKLEKEMKKLKDGSKVRGGGNKIKVYKDPKYGGMEWDGVQDSKTFSKEINKILKKIGVDYEATRVLESVSDKAKAAEAEQEKEQTEKQKKYQAFFQKALKKFGVKSPNELDDAKKKEFFDYIDSNWEGDNEED